MRASRNEDRGPISGASGKGFGAPSLQSETSGSVSEGPKGSERKGPKSPEEVAFEERLAAIRQSAQVKREKEKEQKYSPIDYDNPEKDTSEISSFLTKDLGSKIGVGIAATVFAAIFAFGDILPPVDPSSIAPPDPSSQFSAQFSTLPPKQREAYETRLREFEATLASSPDDRNALEGAAVLSVELGDLPKADSFLTTLEKVDPKDEEVLRLHAEVQYALGKYQDSAQTYRRAIKEEGGNPSVEVLQGLAESLIADNKAKEAVDELLTVRQLTLSSLESQESPQETELDPVQVELLLGKAYAAWGKTGDAAAVYDGIMTKRPEDFRGYLAKALLLQSQGKDGDAQRMFLQAKFLAPEQAKGLVDRLTRQ